MSFLYGIAFYADNRLGIVGAAQPFRRNGAIAEPRKARPACFLSLSKGRQGTAKKENYTSTNENDFESECKEKARKEFSVSEIGSELLLPVYFENAETDYDSSDGLYTCTVKFTYNQNWQSELSESQLETVYKALVANGYIYPSVFTASQFDEYLDSIEKSSAEQKDDKYKG